MFKDLQNRFVINKTEKISNKILYWYMEAISLFMGQKSATDALLCIFL